MHVEDKEMGMRVGYTVLVLLGLMFVLIVLANIVS